MLYRSSCLLRRSKCRLLRNEGATRRTRVVQFFPSWDEHAGIAVFGVGVLNALILLCGFAVTWRSTLKRYELDCRAQSLKSELERTDRQLEVLFGPLHAITHATNVGWLSFLADHNAAFSAEAEVLVEEKIKKRPKDVEATHFRELIIRTLQPLNRRAMELILQNTHLIDGEFPDCLYKLYSHVIEMDSLLERWERRDFTVMFPPTVYPKEVNTWAGHEFEVLRQKQTDLMAQLYGSEAKLFRQLRQRKPFNEFNE